MFWLATYRSHVNQAGLLACTTEVPINFWWCCFLFSMLLLLFCFPLYLSSVFIRKLMCPGIDFMRNPGSGDSRDEGILEIPGPSRHLVDSGYGYIVVQTLSYFVKIPSDNRHYVHPTVRLCQYTVMFARETKPLVVIWYPLSYSEYLLLKNYQDI
jgi:hypothetical protein